MMLYACWKTAEARDRGSIPSMDSNFSLLEELNSLSANVRTLKVNFKLLLSINRLFLVTQ